MSYGQPGSHQPRPGGPSSSSDASAPPVDWKARELAEAWRYGFRWGPLVVERTAHFEGRGYVVTIKTERESMQVYVSEKGRKLRAYEPVPR